MGSLLCVPITVHEPDAALADARTAQALGADLVEFRIDEYFDPPDGSGNAADIAAAAGTADADLNRQRAALARLVQDSPLPCIVTCRHASEGGGYEGPEDQRVSLYEYLGLLDSPPRYLDIELARYVASENIRQKVNLVVAHPGQVRRPQAGLIVSMHDFLERPADLSRRLLEVRQQEAATIVKVAYRARSLRDNLELFEILAERDRPTIALGMGEFGLMSRVLAPKFGGFLTFAALRPAAVTAPGQPTVRELLDQYRFRSIRGTTKVYGVIGWPVGHSKGPLVHNAVFEALGYDGVYLPLPVPVGTSGSVGASGDEAAYTNFKATVGALVDDEGLDFSGASVTLPHKENLARLARERGWELDEASATLGAANTLVIEREAGRLVRASVGNTDVDAAVMPLRAALGVRLKGGEVAVVGAGGVARGVAYGLLRAGARVKVFNRSPERGVALARDLASLGTISAHGLAELPSFRGEALVNGTPVGMAGGPDPAGLSAPLEAMAVGGWGSEAARSEQQDIRPVVMDTVYTPAHTPLLRMAAGLGWRTIDGIGMFAAQAEAQSRLWTHRDPPKGLIEQLARGQERA